MSREEVITILDDLKLSCYNHMRGTPDCHGIEYNRFKMRADALKYAIQALKRMCDE